MKPQSLDRKPQRTMNGYSWVTILAILFMIALLIWFANMQMHEPYYANYIAGGV